MCGKASLRQLENANQYIQGGHDLMKKKSPKVMGGRITGIRRDNMISLGDNHNRITSLNFIS